MEEFTLDTSIIGKPLYRIVIQQHIPEEQAIVLLTEGREGGPPYYITVNEYEHEVFRRWFRKRRRITRQWAIEHPNWRFDDYQAALAEYALIIKDYAAWKMMNLL